MASITTYRGKRGTTFSILWRDSNGARNRETFVRAATARQFKAWVEQHPDSTLAEWEAERNGGHAATTRRTVDGPTIADLYRLMVDGRDTDVSESRVETDDSLYRNQLASLHKVPVKALRVSEVKAWRRDMQTTPRRNDKPYAPATIRAARTVLRAIVQVAVDDGIIHTNPVDSVDPPDVERPELTAGDVLSISELEAFLKATPKRYRALFALMGYTGCRLSEALGLTPALVDLEAGVIHLGIFRVQEVGGKPQVKPGAKTRGSKRDPWLDAEVIELLRTHLEDYPAGDDDQIFRTESGAIPNRSNLLKRQFRPALKAAGIDKDLDVMNLRHTAISHMLQASMPVVNVAARVGHANPTMTLNTYARFIPATDGTNPDALRMIAWRDGQQR